MYTVGLESDIRVYFFPRLRQWHLSWLNDFPQVKHIRPHVQVPQEDHMRARRVDLGFVGSIAMGVHSYRMEVANGFSHPERVARKHACFLMYMILHRIVDLVVFLISGLPHAGHVQTISAMHG